MAVDTRDKRASSVSARRLPWMRGRFLPLPDGSVAGADRQHAATIYRGVAAVVVVPRSGGAIKPVFPGVTVGPGDPRNVTVTIKPVMPGVTVGPGDPRNVTVTIKPVMPSNVVKPELE